MASPAEDYATFLACGMQPIHVYGVFEPWRRIAQDTIIVFYHHISAVEHWCSDECALVDERLKIAVNGAADEELVWRIIIARCFE